MKDQYFGDENDFCKYGLLRAIQCDGTHRLLVVWMLTEDRDGNRRSYLTSPGKSKKWSECDPGLHDGLRKLLEPMPKSVMGTSLFEDSNLLDRNRTSYFSRPVPDRREKRFAWGREMLDAAAGNDIVFLDPDNGIEVRSKEVGRRYSSKYVLWKELDELWEKGHSLVIYQHFPFKRRDQFVSDLRSELRRRCCGATVTALRTAHVVFFLVAQEGHKEMFEMAACHVDSTWHGKMRIAT